MKIVEKFISIDGEGPTAGGLSVFIRFAGCNLHCAWCDTCYAQKEYSYTEDLTVPQIVDYVRSTDVKLTWQKTDTLAITPSLAFAPASTAAVAR